MIVCGFCGADTYPLRCERCGRDPALPWIQRAQTPPTVDESERRRRLLAEAEKDIRSSGLEPTIERLADRLGVDPRTVRRWRRDVRPSPSDVRPDEPRMTL